MRVALVTEGYPDLIGGVSTWCDQLVHGLPDVSWHLVTTGDAPANPVFALPPNVASLTRVPGKGRRRPPAEAAGRLCRGMLGDSAGALAVFAEALRELAAEPARPPGAPPPDMLLDSWTAATELLDQRLPRLTRAEAETAAVLVEQALRPLAVPVPPVDVCHAAGGGSPALVALAVASNGVVYGRPGSGRVVR